MDKSPGRGIPLRLTCLNLSLDKNLSKPIKILISEQVALAATSYFEQVFVFCMIFNKNVLVWFLLILCKEHILHRSKNCLSRKHSTLCSLLIKKGRKMPWSTQYVYWVRHGLLSTPMVDAQYWTVILSS